MKIRLQTQDLVKALYRVQGIVDKKSTNPILAHALFQTKDNLLEVRATDLEIALKATYPVAVETPGAIAVQAKQLYEIVKALNTDELTLEASENHWITVKSGKSEFRLIGTGAEDFPALPESDNSTRFQIDTAKFSNLIEQTIFCVSHDDTRHHLGGVYCEAPDQQTLRMVSTDGHRLALSESNLDNTVHIAEPVIVPRKAFQEVKRLLADAGSSVEVGFTSKSFHLETDAFELSTRLIEGKFPEYSQVIPVSASKEVPLNRSLFAEALKRVSLLSQGRAWGVKLEIQNEQVEFIAEDPEFGTAKETIEIPYKGDALTIGFNAKYLLDVLNLIQTDEVVFQLTDDLSPGVLRPLDQKDFLAVVMPVRI